jgi:hypothetical protein
MKVDTLEINKIISASESAPKWVYEAREYNKTLEALVNGKDFTELLIKIEHKEDDKKTIARKRYARSIKDIFEKLLRPTDNIYSATGGSKNYPKNISSKVLDKLTKMRDDKTLEKWLQINWFRLYHTDPNGIIMFEWSKEDFYPVYKNISSIRNYKSNGQKVEWILFEPTIENSNIYWRFIDDVKDYTIQDTNGQLVIIEDKSYENPYGVPPVLINSDLIVLGSELRLSPLHNIIELAKEMLRDSSHKSIFKFLLWDPLFWRYAVKCNTCHGIGKKGTGDCPDCYKGYYISKDITDAVILPAPDDKETQKLAPDIAGFIVPPVTIMDEFNKEIELLYKQMTETHWGTTIESEVTKTATEIYQNVQPVINRLNVYADICEYCEQWMTYLTLKKLGENTEGLSILYGRDYIIEGTSVLLQRYEDSRAKGDSTAILDKELREWLLSKYKNDPKTLNEEKKRLQIEPFIHMTIKEVQEVWGDSKAKRKSLFQQWWMNADKNKNEDVLIKEFNSYCNLLLGLEKETNIN